MAEVAGALVLSEEAVKQRLSRGRGMLREQVAELVESGLRRSRPGRTFTVTVMAGLAAHAAGTKTALAGAGASAGVWKAAASRRLPGARSGGILGTLGGLLGGWLGTWVPAQVAPTLRERDAIFRAGWRTLLVSIVFIAALFGLINALAGKPGYIIAWGGWMVAFWAYIAVESVCLARAVKHIRAAQDPDDLPNETALRAGLAAIAERIGDRVYRSEATFLGLPLIDINWSAPMPPERGKPLGSASTRRAAGCSRLDRDWRRRQRHLAGDRFDGPRIGRIGRACLWRREFRRGGAGAGRDRRPRAGRCGDRRARRRRVCLRRRSGRLAGGRRTGGRLGHRLRRRCVCPACGHRRRSDRPRLCCRRRRSRPPRQRRGGPRGPPRSPIHAIRVHRAGSAAGARASSPTAAAIATGLSSRRRQTTAAQVPRSRTA